MLVMRCALSCIRAATLLPDMSGALIALQLLLKSMSKVVARIARIAIISSFYIEFGFSQLESILVPKKLIFYCIFSEKIDFFSEKMKMKNFPILERLFSTSSEAHGWIPQAFLSPNMYMV